MSDLKDLSKQLAKVLLDKGMQLAVAESCTGGWLAKCLTDIAGSSTWFERGFVTYSNAAKREMLGVSAGTLAEHGAVSEAVVREMAQGVLAHSPADIAVAISGIAGPGGGTPDKPVGTVCFAWAARDGFAEVVTCRFDGDRDAVRRHAVRHALERLPDLLAHG
ncbi:MAG: nicotinamide-nucleotide amidase [Gammaproteobacteria bacterium]|nr:nicotinamide-nucleotide amidase [Gammaproteobacteria bacterium]